MTHPATPEAMDAAWAHDLRAIAQERDEAAFGRLFAHFAPRVKAAMMRAGLAPGAAEDLAQETMAAVWRKAHLFDPARGAAAGWIYAVARNQRLDLLRRSARHMLAPEPSEAADEPDDGAPPPEDVLSLAERSAALRLALEDLPAAQRDAVRRAFFEEMSHSDIAAATALPLGTIKSRLRLALERLRAALKGFEEQP